VRNEAPREARGAHRAVDADLRRALPLVDPDRRRVVADRDVDPDRDVDLDADVDFDPDVDLDEVDLDDGDLDREVDPEADFDFERDLDDLVVWRRARGTSARTTSLTSRWSSASR
jgi:hypothetical protein